ncbi:hypothetical protein GQ457_05G016790 [Hibiscus cannabinus]
MTSINNEKDQTFEPTQIVEESQETRLEENENEEDDLKKRSFVWDHFKYEKNITSAKCPYCKRMIKCDSKKNGTSGLGKHLKMYCRQSPCYKLPDKKQKTLNFSPPQPLSGKSDVKGNMYNQVACRMALARMCIKDNRPFSIVEDEGFVEYSSTLNPKFKLPSRWTVARDCFNIYKEESKVIKNLLVGQRVSLTTDTWTSVQNINYMCLTAHWVDDNWRLVKKILNFCQISNHKGVTIGKLVYACLKKWGVNKVFTITVDNAASNDGAITYLKKELMGPDSILDGTYMHLRCCAHIVNLIVRDGLEDQHASIVKIRNAVRYVRSSPARLLKFEACVEKEKIVCGKKVSLDVDTRWNSTYLMLDTAIMFEKAFRRLNLEDGYMAYFIDDYEEEFEVNTRKRKRKKKVVGPPCENDWTNARYFVEFLKIFYIITLKISASKHVTANLFFNEIVKMHVKISKMCSSGDEKCRSMAIRMKEKYDKYWDNIDNINFLLYIAVVLDPQKKMKYVELCLKKIYENNGEKQAMFLQRVKNTLEALYEEYVRLASSGDCGDIMGGSTSLSVAPILLDIDDDDFLEKEFERDLLVAQGKENKSEIDIYLCDDVLQSVGDDYDILLWWKSNSSRYPTLSQIARNVLGMPISTVASESAFSTGGRVIDPFRSSLNPRTA